MFLTVINIYGYTHRQHQLYLSEKKNLIILQQNFPSFQIAKSLRFLRFYQIKSHKSPFVLQSENISIKGQTQFHEIKKMDICVATLSSNKKKVLKSKVQKSLMPPKSKKKKKLKITQQVSNRLQIVISTQMENFLNFPHL